MNFEKLLTDAYNSSDVINACKNISGENWEDLRGQIVLKLLEMPEEKRLNIKSVKGFFIRSCWNAGLDIKRKYKNIKFTELTELPTEETPINERLFIIAKIKQDIESPKRFYHARVFLYSNVYGSVTNLHKKILATGLKIDYNELLHTYRSYKKYLIDYEKNCIR